MAARKVQNLTCVKGRYRRTLGKFFNSNGKLAPKKFLLGRDVDQAERANLRLEQLWRDIERFWRDEPTARRYPAHAVWEPLTLHMAEAIRLGNRIQIPEEMLRDRAEWGGTTKDTVAQWFWWIKKTYPSVADLIDDPASEIYQDSRQHAKSHAQALARLSSHLADVASEPAAAAAPGQTLHKALEAWAEVIRKEKTRHDGKLIEGGRKIIDSTKRFRENHTDIPLARLDYKAVSEIVDYWRSRPPSKSKNRNHGKPISVTTVKNYLSYFRRFLIWLHRCDAFDWRDTDRLIEDAVGRRQSAPLRTPEEVKQSAKGPDSWRVDELVKLYVAASHRERLYLLLGLNGGFAQSEIIHLLKDEIHLDHDPPDIRYIRHKSGKPAAFTLWPETIEALTWAQQQTEAADAGKTAWAVTSKSGKPLIRQQIATCWQALLNRVRHEDEEFRDLSFKYLRKTNASLLQQCGADSEVVAIVHGRAKRSPHDDQADVYYPRMVSKVYPAMSEMRERLRPMFDAVDRPFSGRQVLPRHNRRKRKAKQEPASS